MNIHWLSMLFFLFFLSRAFCMGDVLASTSQTFELEPEAYGNGVQ